MDRKQLQGCTYAQSGILSPKGKKEAGKTLARLNQEVKRLQSEYKNVVDNKQKKFKKLKLPATLKKRLTFTAELGSWLDDRKRMNLMSNHHIQQFMEEYSNMASITPHQAYWVLPEEMLPIIQGKLKLPHREIARRKHRTFFLLTQPEKRTIVFGTKAEKLIRFLEKTFDKIHGIENMQGFVANRRNQKYIIGRVRIVLDPYQADFSQGNILVASQTRPEYVPLMKKASCVITDEGGITSHAAIVSRELGIPCIIGAKFATKVLKDGDSIKVNTDNGVIKKL